MIRCLGCRETFEDFESIVKHRSESDHPDVGEVYK
jgi:hypothetical protein